MSAPKPSKWASPEVIKFHAQTLSPAEVEALVEFADRVDALLIDETRKVDSGFTIRDARHNLMRSTNLLRKLRADAL